MIGRLLRWEWRHWSTRREIRVALIALPLATLIWAWLSAHALRSDLVPAFLSGSDATGFALAYRNARALHWLLALLLLLWSSNSMSAELETGLLRPVLLRVARAKLLWAKALHLLLVAAAISLTIVLLSLGMGAWQFGLQPVELGQLTVHGTGGLVASGLLATLLNLLPLAALIALGMLLGSVGMGSRASTSAALLAVVVLWALGQMPGLAPFSFVGLAGQPFAVAIAQAEGYRTESHSQGLWILVLSCSAWAAVCLTIATWHFSRRDLK